MPLDADDPINGINEQVSALRRELKLTWGAHEREHTQHEQAHGREHEFAAEAIRTAATLAKENKADANEWRSSMNDREARFATKDDVKSILGRLDGIERAGLVSIEREANRAKTEADEKRELSDRQQRSQWVVGLVVGLLATVGAVLVNLVLRLA